MDIIDSSIYNIVEYTTSDKMYGFENEYFDKYITFDYIFNTFYKDNIMIYSKYKISKLEKIVKDIYYIHSIYLHGIPTLITYLNKKNVYLNIKQKYII